MATLKFTLNKDFIQQKITIKDVTGNITTGVLMEVGDDFLCVSGDDNKTIVMPVCNIIEIKHS